MVIVSKLIGKAGSVRDILGIDSSEADLVDISDNSWRYSLEVLKDLDFIRVQLKKTDVKVNFSRCKFENSFFEKLQSDGHFFAADNIWASCNFSNLDFRDVATPRNIFTDCVFQEVKFSKFRPCNTLFRGCRFKNFQVEGMKAARSSGRTIIPELFKSGVEIAFIDCDFVNSLFLKSFFDSALFKNCRFKDLSVEACDFSGVISDAQWWPPEVNGSSPFMELLKEILACIEKKLGASSQSYHVMSDYIIDYTTGRTSSRDYSECLYDGRVPSQELNVLEKELDEIESKFCL